MCKPAPHKLLAVTSILARHLCIQNSSQAAGLIPLSPKVSIVESCNSTTASLQFGSSRSPSTGHCRVSDPAALAKCTHAHLALSKDGSGMYDENRVLS